MLQYSINKRGKHLVLALTMLILVYSASDAEELKTMTISSPLGELEVQFEPRSTELEFDISHRNVRAYALGWQYFRKSFVPRPDDVFMIETQFPAGLQRVIFERGNMSETFSVSKEVVKKNSELYGCTLSRLGGLKTDSRKLSYLEVDAISEEIVKETASRLDEVDFLSISFDVDPALAAKLINELEPKLLHFYKPDFVPRFVHVLEKPASPQNRSRLEIQKLQFVGTMLNLMQPQKRLKWVDFPYLNPASIDVLAEKTEALFGVKIDGAIDISPVIELIHANEKTLRCLWFSKQTQVEWESHHNLEYLEELEHLRMMLRLDPQENEARRILPRLKTVSSPVHFLSWIKSDTLQRIEIIGWTGCLGVNLTRFKNLLYLEMKSVTPEYIVLPSSLRTLVCDDCSVTKDFAYSTLANLTELRCNMLTGSRFIDWGDDFRALKMKYLSVREIHAEAHHLDWFLIPSIKEIQLLDGGYRCMWEPLLKKNNVGESIYIGLLDPESASLVKESTNQDSKVSFTQVANEKLGDDLTMLFFNFVDIFSHSPEVCWDKFEAMKVVRRISLISGKSDGEEVE